MAEVARAALLIGAPQLTGHPYLVGVNADMSAVHRFLTSPHGGAWRNSEIHQLTNPRKSAVLGLLAQLEKNTEYLLTFFGGHGSHVLELGQTSLCLNDAEEISVAELFPSIPRQVLVVDACRKLTRLTEQYVEMADALYAEKAVAHPIYTQSCRQLFDRAIQAAERGRVVMYSCSVDESADDGLFTPALVRAAEQWAEKHAPPLSLVGASHIYDVPTAFEKANNTTVTANRLQTPVLHNGRRLGQFPFAVA
jgi:hypothetical protein